MLSYMRHGKQIEVHLLGGFRVLVGERLNGNALARGSE